MIGIIALLAAIIFGVLAKTRESGRRVQCLSNMKSIAQAILMYAQTNDNALPGDAGKTAPYQDHDWLWWESVPGNGGALRISQINQHGIGKYIDVSDLTPAGLNTLRCPSDSRLRGLGFFDTTPDQSGMPYPTGYPFNYVINGLMCSGNPPTELGTFNPPVTQSAVVRTITAVKDAANKILVYEEDRRTIDDGYGLLIPNRANTNILSIRHDGFDEGQSVQDSTDVSMNPTSPPTVAVLKNGEKMGNVAFCDGHAAAIDRVSAHSKDHSGARPRSLPRLPLNRELLVTGDAGDADADRRARSGSGSDLVRRGGNCCGRGRRGSVSRRW